MTVCALTLLTSGCGGPASSGPIATRGAFAPSPPAASPVATPKATSHTAPGTLVGTADFVEVFVNGEFNSTTNAHATDVVWQLDPTSRLRPAGVAATDVISVYTAVSGRVDWSYTGVVQGSISATCTVTKSGSEVLPDGGGSEWYRAASLMIDSSEQPATYSVLSSFDGLPAGKCMDWEGTLFDGEWVKSDPFADPIASGTDGAWVLVGSYDYPGMVHGTYSWDFRSAP